MSLQKPLYTLIAELSDIFGEWDDVMDTANELEQLLTDGMSQLANFDYSSLTEDVQQGLNEIKDKLEDTNFLDGLGDQIKAALEDLKDQVNIDLEAPFEVPDVGDLSNIKELIDKYLPKVPGVDFGPMTDAITKLMNLVDFPDLGVAIRKTPGGSFPEGVEATAQAAINAAIPPATSNNINTQESTVNNPSTTSAGAPPDHDWLQAIIPDWKTHEDTIAGLMTKLESAFEELAIMDKVQTSMDQLMPQIEQLKSAEDIIPILTTLIKDVSDQVEPALKRVLDIFTEAFEGFKKLLISLKAAKLPKDLDVTQWYQLLTFGGGKEPGLFTLPCLVLALPLCFMSKALTGKRPELRGVFQAESQAKPMTIVTGCMEVFLGTLGLIMQLAKASYGENYEKNGYHWFWQNVNEFTSLILDIIKTAPYWIKEDEGEDLECNERCTGIFESIAYVGWPIISMFWKVIFQVREEKKRQNANWKKYEWYKWPGYDDNLTRFGSLVFDTLFGGIFMSIWYSIQLKENWEDSNDKSRARSIILIVRTFLGYLDLYKKTFWNLKKDHRKPGLEFIYTNQLTVNVKFSEKDYTESYKYVWFEKINNEWKKRSDSKVWDNPPQDTQIKVQIKGKLFSKSSILSEHESIPINIPKIPKVCFEQKINNNVSTFNRSLKVEGQAWTKIDWPNFTDTALTKLNSLNSQGLHLTISQEKNEVVNLEKEINQSELNEKEISNQVFKINFDATKPELDITLFVKDIQNSKEIELKPVLKGGSEIKWEVGTENLTLDQNNGRAVWKDNEQLKVSFKQNGIQKEIITAPIVGPEIEKRGPSKDWLFTDSYVNDFTKFSYERNDHSASDKSQSELNKFLKQNADKGGEIKITYTDRLGVKKEFTWKKP